MDTKDLYRFAYVKRPLSEAFSERASVPEAYLVDWLKDSYDRHRPHSDEELQRFLSLTPDEILTWLEEGAEFVWEVQKVSR
jgi:hypothetical protein